MISSRGSAAALFGNTKGRFTLYAQKWMSSTSSCYFASQNHRKSYQNSSFWENRNFFLAIAGTLFGISQYYNTTAYGNDKKRSSSSSLTFVPPLFGRHFVTSCEAAEPSNNNDASQETATLSGIGLESKQALHSIELGPIERFQEGKMYEFKVFGGKERVLLVRKNGEFYCLANSCSHYSAPLVSGVLTEDRIKCPWHDAEFDIKTGRCVGGAGLNSIPVYSTSLSNGKVFVQLPRNMMASMPAKQCKRDLNDKRLYAIVGSGAAAVTAADALREEGFTGRIVIVTKEKILPYDRPVISKNLFAPLDMITLRKSDYYEDADIEFLFDSEVQELRTRSNSLILKNGTSLSYDKVLVATGSEPRNMGLPGENLKNIFTLRRPEDAERISQFAQQGNRVVIVGSSFVGIETAAAISKWGAKVTIVAHESVPFEKLLGKRVGEAFKKMVISQGIEFFGGKDVVGFSSKRGKVNGVKLDDGNVIQADCVVLGIGVEPQCSFLVDVPKEKDGSVRVDPFFKIEGASNAYAAGDIATFPFFKIGSSIRIEHWNVALQHGRIAARNMCGQHVTYGQIPFFWSVVFGKSLRYAGYAKNYDDVVIEGDLENFKFIAYYIQGKKVAAVATMGMDQIAVAACEALRLGLMPSVAELRLGLANSESIMENLNVS